MHLRYEAKRVPDGLSNWQLGQLIFDIGGIILSALDGLNAAIANLQSQVSAESTELAGVVNGLTAAQAQLKTLTDQLNSGVQVSTSDLNNLTATITQIADSAAAATAAATAATGGGTPPPPPPAPAP